jgi:hypothetical protein
MATTIPNTTLDKVRERVQAEGRRLSRVREDITALVNRNPLVVLDDVCNRATAAAKELEKTQRERLSNLFAPLGRLTSQLMARYGFASANEVAELKRRVDELERRVSRSKAA